MSGFDPRVASRNALEPKEMVIEARNFASADACYLASGQPMKLVAEYVAEAVKFERLAATEKNPEFKAQLENKGRRIGSLRWIGQRGWACHYPRSHVDRPQAVSFVPARHATSLIGTSLYPGACPHTPHAPTGLEAH